MKKKSIVIKQQIEIRNGRDKHRHYGGKNDGIRME